MKVKVICLVFLLATLAVLLYAGITQNPRVDRTECVGCGDCTHVCPTGAISLVNGRAIIDDEKCIDCKFCVRTCTYRAIRAPK